MKREYKINRAAIDRIIELGKKYPDMTANEIKEMICGAGLVCTISESTIYKIKSAGSYEAYNQRREMERERIKKRRAKNTEMELAKTDEMPGLENKPDTSLTLREKADATKADISPAAAEMIGNQKRILEGRGKMIMNQDETKDWLVGVTVRLENIGLLLNALLNTWTGDPIGIRERLTRLRDQ